MHPGTYDYLEPTEDQKVALGGLRSAAKAYSDVLESLLPDGPDKTFTLRQLRQTAMWANIAVTRQADGSPRQ